jgi:putative ABC transport system substrate-binding protein
VSDVANNLTNRALIARLTEEMRIPAIYSYRESVEARGLVAYSYDLSDMFRGIASQIDYIRYSKARDQAIFRSSSTANSSYP